MSIPGFQALMLPILRLSDQGEIRLSVSVRRISDEINLTEPEREELTPSGLQTKIMNRVSWAVTHLVKHGLVHRPRHGHYVITSKGKEFLSTNPERIDMAILKRIFGDDQSDSNSSPNVENAGDVEMTDDPEAGTPEERADAAIAEIDAALREELLERILNMQPAAFEKLIVDLMLGMGYGARGSGERIGRSGDGGVDGVINEDALGLDVIYLQAKRYAQGNNIGPEVIRAFSGAMQERNATKGVFVTTSKFTRGAVESANNSRVRLILIDGEKLTELLTEYGVGVRDHRTLKIKKIDADYFDSAES